MKKVELSIPNPCHEDWNSMTPQDRGRFCAACQKTVIDFSQMSDPQIAEFFKKPIDSVCGHFNRAQLNRVIDVPRKRIPWVRYFFTIALPAFLFSLKAGAQGEVRLRGRVAVRTQPDKKEQCETPVGKPEIVEKLKGQILDSKGNPVPQASVFVKYTNSGTKSNEQGNFELSVQALQGKEISISAIGYLSQTISFEQLSKQKYVTLTLEPVTNGEYVVTMGMVVSKKAKTIPLVEPKRIDTAFSKFAVYPNPVSAGTSITIAPKNLEAGNYYIQVINSTGEILQSTEVVMEKKTMRLNFQLTQLSAGSYFVRLTNRHTNKSYTEIIIVQ